MEYVIKKTDDLSPAELVQVFQMRTKVFVVEQSCPYQEVDELDFEAIHIIFKDNEKIVAYLRVIEVDNVIHIGRVLVDPNYRRHSYGKKIVAYAIDYVKENLETNKIIISAQSRLIDFYSAFGFNAISEVYLEDDIPHIDMELKL
ncbi:GNAT family N-acetyltransferase [Mammaliicoccus sp. Dog046]|uniref:GNAT family N-acetyltransferase n=1 Tax=Mammaliicoccus sp. Dog046 TaxID=3034233 RepID=UPI002B25E05D|nr:GNAT family N-acetyltransferase [Mammaliicoccus sp. Dog046]WQK84644.1 GNAT family N-acetyltransferase [Mammaliicoccus sp. Dog046]